MRKRILTHPLRENFINAWTRHSMMRNSNWKRVKLAKFCSVKVMLVTSLCLWLNDSDHLTMLVTRKVCWWHFSACWWHFNPMCYVGEMKFSLVPNSIKFFKSWTDPEGLALVTNIIIRQNVMLVTDSWCWCLTLDVGDVTCNLHPNHVTNTFGLQTFCTATSMLVTDVGTEMCWWQLWDVGAESLHWKKYITKKSPLLRYRR